MGYYRGIFIVLSFFFTVSICQAQQTIEKSSQVEVVNGKSYFIHTIEKGQTLYSLSKAYNVPIGIIVRENNIQNGELKRGQQIRIPQILQESTPKPSVSINGKSYLLHKVEKGETLFSIGRKYGLKPNVILAENPETSANIDVGQMLKIPADSTVSSPKEPVISTSEYPQTTVHIVQKGESLYSIAKHYNSSVVAIIAKNPECRDELKAGSSIEIPLPPKKREFMYHKVQKGETLYSIAKKYGLSTDQIQKDNPGTKYGLKLATFLKLEKTEGNAHLERTYPGYSFHTVAQGETFFSICRKYDAKPKTVKKLNSGRKPSELAIGDLVMIPALPVQIEELDSITVVEKPEVDTIPQFFSCDSIRSEEKIELEVAMLLPLFLTANDTISLSENIISRQEKVYSHSLPFVQFYEGALMALDSLKKLGYSVKLSVFDTEKDTNRVKQILGKLDFENLDLMIGPVYPSNFILANKTVSKYDLPIISPLASTTSGVIDNPNSIVVNTPQEYRIETASFYIAQKNDYNFLMIHNGHVKDFEIMDSYKKVLFSTVTDSALFSDVVFKELNFSEQGIEGVQDALSIGSKNIIIVPSTNQGYVNNIVTQLYQFQRKFDIELLGLSVWEQYNNIELDYLFGLNYHFGTNYFVDYSNPEVVQFVQQYRDLFKTEPTKYSFHGYDVLSYFVPVLNQYPIFACECLAESTYQGLQSRFEFERYSEGKGNVNTNVSLVRYTKDYSIERVDFDAQEARKEFKERQQQEAAGDPNFEDLFSE